jgi:cytochrome c biogenesis protein CcdA
MNKPAYIRLLAILVFLSMLLGLSQIIWAQQPSSTANEDSTIYLFWREGCSYCAQMKVFLAGLQNEYPHLKILSYNIGLPENNLVWEKKASEYGVEANYLPHVFYKGKSWVGYSLLIADEIRAAVDTKIADPVKKIHIPLFGEVELAEGALLLNTIIIAFADGLNPCSLWILSLLLTMVIVTHSRKRLFVVGFTFLIITSLVYSLFIIGLFSIFDNFMAYERSIQLAVSAIAIIFGLINVKDFFWFKKGVSLTISEKRKPGIYQKIRQLITQDQSLTAMILTTASLALGVTLAELPCTSGLPVTWTNMLITQGVNSLTFGLLLFVYLLIFLIDELTIFILAVVTMKASRLQEKHGRFLKLIGGTIMITLGIVMLWRPELMKDIYSSLMVFAIAFATAVFIMGVHWVFKPKPDTKAIPAKKNKN